jgi:anaerobic magnesium-protoporphyrin IX monomethyl ester cyclase
MILHNFKTQKRLAFIQPMINDGNFTPPIGMLIMSAIMENNGWEVCYFDERLGHDVIKLLVDFKPSIVGISAVTPSVLRGRELADEIKKVLPETFIVFGGPHPTSMPEEVAGWDSVDFVVVGEGEHALSDLCQWFLSGKEPSELSKIPNLCYKINGNVVHNEIHSFLLPQELDLLPMPAFHILDIEQIFRKTRHGLFQKGNRILPIMGSRGCPNRCTFCCRMMGYKIRYRDTKLLINEIETMVKRYNLDEIYFEDDNFTVNQQRALDILNSLIERDLGVYIKFANGIRADAVNAEILDRMKKAGCYSISFGIESGSPRVLNMMRKNLSLDKARENVKLAKSMGLLVGSNCIIGYPGETVSDIDESLDYFLSLDLDSMAVVNLIPFPGTEVRRICEENGYLTPEAKNWNNYIFDIDKPRILIETELMDRATLLYTLNRAYRKIYLNPRKVLKILTHMKPKEIIKGSKMMLSKILKPHK